jgi:hypothetical protein
VFPSSIRSCVLRLRVSFSYCAIWRPTFALRLSICSSVFGWPFFLQDFPSRIRFGILLSNILPTCPVHCILLICTYINWFHGCIRSVQLFILPYSVELNITASSWGGGGGARFKGGMLPIQNSFCCSLVKSCQIKFMVVPWLVTTVSFQILHKSAHLSQSLSILHYTSHTDEKEFRKLRTKTRALVFQYNC